MTCDEIDKAYDLKRKCERLSSALKNITKYPIRRIQFCYLTPKWSGESHEDIIDLSIIISYLANITKPQNILN